MSYIELIALWFVVKFVCSEISMSPKRQLMVIMIDGARWDYMELLDSEKLGGFKYFKERGVRTEYVEPIYPSVSYPAWTTLSTGLYPESHGIIGNVMYDKVNNLEFLLGKQSVTKLPLWWQEVEPIWTTATRAGLQVATIEWSRSDIPVRGVLPKVATGYSSTKRDIHDKLKEALLFLKMDFDLVMVYYEKVDAAGHTFGPDSEAVNLFMAKVGSALENLFQGLFKENLIDNVDIIIVSDHGMTSSCNLPPINISQVIDMKRDTIKVLCESTLVGIFAKPGMELKLYNQLKYIPDYILKCKSNIPTRFHYKNSKRAPDFLLYAKYKKRSYCPRQGGVHGFDPEIPDMRSLFLAYGKSFQDEGMVLKPIHMVDIYQIYCRILKIEPQPHNGTWENVRSMMALEYNDRQMMMPDYFMERRKFTFEWDTMFAEENKRRKSFRETSLRNILLMNKTVLETEFATIEHPSCW